MSAAAPLSFAAKNLTSVAGGGPNPTGLRKAAVASGLGAG